MRHNHNHRFPFGMFANPAMLAAAMKGGGRFWRGGGDFGDFGGGGHGGRRGRRSRMFAAGQLRLLLLKLLADEPRHGYDLIKAIEELTGGHYAPSPGVVYPSLQLLLDEGMIEEQPDDSARKAFAVTEAGKAELDKESDAVAAILERLQHVCDRQGDSTHLQVKRSVENLHAVLRNLRHEDQLTREQTEAIVDIIDEAARRIERL